MDLLEALRGLGGCLEFCWPAADEVNGGEQGSRGNSQDQERMSFVSCAKL